MNTIAIIVNSKHKKQLKRIEREIKGKFNNLKELDIQIFKSSNNVSLRKLAAKCAENFQTLIAVGGDGTLHEVLNGIFDSKKENTCILGFIPIGSANDFHKTLKGAKSVEEIIHKLEKNRIKNLSIGKVTFSSDKSSKTKCYFINIASLGMGYEVMKKVNNSTKNLGANLAYFLGILKTFLSYKNIEIKCETKEWQWEGKIKSLAVANGKYFGSGLCIAPHANPFSDSFAVTIVGNVSIWTYLLKLVPLKLGKFIKHPAVTYDLTKQLTITSEIPCGIEADGEVLGTTPATFEILPNAIQFLY